MLMEIDKAHITTESIFTNLVRDVGRENIPENHSFYELLPAQDKVEEYSRKIEDGSYNVASENIAASILSNR